MGKHCRSSIDLQPRMPAVFLVRNHSGQGDERHHHNDSGQCRTLGRTGLGPDTQQPETEMAGNTFHCGRQGCILLRSGIVGIDRERLVPVLALQSGMAPVPSHRPAGFHCR